MSSTFHDRLAELDAVKSITQAQRDALDDKDFAGPGRTFPCRNQADLDAAAHLIGKAKDPEAVKRRLISIAKKKGLRLPAAWDSDADNDAGSDTDADGKALADPSDTLISYGSTVKALDTEGRRVGGWLVLFGDPDSADLQGEYFTKATDFGPLRAGRIRFHHTRDPELGLCPIGEATATVKDEGIWCEGIIGIKAADAERWARGILGHREAYEAKVLDMIKAGKLGWSSAAASHLVRTMARGKAREITSWPLADDFTLSPTPCDPRNVAVVPLKSLLTADEAAPARSLESDLQKLATDAEELCPIVERAIKARLADGRTLSAPKLDALKAAHARLGELIRAATPKADPREVLKLQAEFLRLTRAM